MQLKLYISLLVPLQLHPTIFVCLILFHTYLRTLDSFPYDINSNSWYLKVCLISKQKGRLFYFYYVKKNPLYCSLIRL